MESKDFYIKPFHLIRRFSVDSTRLSKKRNYVHGLLDIDIQELSDNLRRQKKEEGRKISLTAWLLKTIADLVAENPEIQAMRSRNRMVIFRDVDIMIAVETRINGESFPVVHVLRKVNSKSAEELTGRIKELKESSVNKEKLKEWRKARYFIVLPWFIRKIIYGIIMSSPHRFRRWGGTVAFTAIGMFGKGGGWGINLPNHSLAFTIGGISEKPVHVAGSLENHRFLNITVSFDHDVIDGAPGSRFISRLRQRLEKPGIRY